MSESQLEDHIQRHQLTIKQCSIRGQRLLHQSQPLPASAVAADACLCANFWAGADLGCPDASWVMAHECVACWQIASVPAKASAAAGPQLDACQRSASDLLSWGWVQGFCSLKAMTASSQCCLSSGQALPLQQAPERGSSCCCAAWGFPAERPGLLATCMAALPAWSYACLAACPLG